MSAHHPSRAIVDLNAYASNLALVRRFAGSGAGLIPVLKANAYGHGAVPLAKKALEAEPLMLGVATVPEAIELREAGIDAPILLMIQPNREALPLCIQHKLTLVISDTGLADGLGKLAAEANWTAPVHVKVNTGMGRQGASLDDALNTIQYISRIVHVDIQGICTHFSTSELQEDAFTLSQIKRFRSLMKQVEKIGIPYEIAHTANSAAIVHYRESHFDAVRPGLITYGVWPSREKANTPQLKPVLRWETRIVYLRDLAPGSTIGYGRTFTTFGDTRTAVLPVGYADGYRHSLSNKADVLIRGRRCPVRGAVSMDQIVVDVSALPHVAVGDVATLIGRDGSQEITVEELAGKAGTIPYDILTGLGARVHREYLHEAR